MTICLEIYSNVKVLCGMMKVFNACGYTFYGETLLHPKFAFTDLVLVPYLGQVLGGSSISISGLNHPNFDLLLKTCRLRKIHYERRNKRGYFITIEHMEIAALIKVIINQPVRVTVKTASALTGLQSTAEGRWEPL